MLSNWIYFWDVGAGAGTSVDTWEDIYPSQFPQSNFLVYQGIANSENQSYGDIPSLPPKLFAAVDVQIIGYKGFGISTPFRDHGNEWINYIVVTDRTWDDVSEQSIPNPNYYIDHLSDEGVEHIQLSSLTYYTWDDQSEHSLQQLLS